MVYQHPKLKFVVCPQATHNDLIQNLCTIVSMFYPLQSFGYINLIIFMHAITIRLELCGIRTSHKLTMH